MTRTRIKSITLVGNKFSRTSINDSVLSCLTWRTCYVRVTTSLENLEVRELRKGKGKVMDCYKKKVIAWVLHIVVVIIVETVIF